MIIIKNFIKEIAKEFNITSLTVAPFRNFSEIEESVAKRQMYPFESGTLQEKINPSLLFENGKSILVCLFSYYNTKAQNLQISSYSALKDYHKVLSEKLNGFCEKIKEHYRELEYNILIDSHPLPERYIATLSGAGFIGKNQCLINDKTGSICFIGLVLTNLELERDLPDNRNCIGCNKCINACPTGALSEAGYNVHKCLSAITQLKTLSDEQLELLKKSRNVFGCDECQKVCPHNKELEDTTICDFKDIAYPTYDELKNISNKEFKEKYGEYSFAWRGKTILLRNFETIYNK